MPRLLLSENQITDALGSYADAAASIDNYAAFDTEPIPRPAYGDAAAGFGIDASTYHSFEVPPAYAHYLQHYPGLHVIVGAQVKDRSEVLRDVYFPGIVLPGREACVGYLCAGPDVIRDDDTLRQRTLRPPSDFQVNLLDQVYGMHKEGVGEHGGTSSVNVADAPHGTVIAITAPAETGGLHGAVHRYMATGLASRVSDRRALDVSVGPNGHDIRRVRERIMPAAHATRIIVSREHQLPSASGLQLGAGELAISVTLAAVRSKRDCPQPDLRLGMAAMIGELR